MIVAVIVARIVVAIANMEVAEMESAATYVEQAVHIASARVKAAMIVIVRPATATV